MEAHQPAMGSCGVDLETPKFPWQKEQKPLSCTCVSERPQSLVSKVRPATTCLQVTMDFLLGACLAEFPGSELSEPRRAERMGFSVALSVARPAGGRGSAREAAGVCTAIGGLPKGVLRDAAGPGGGDHGRQDCGVCPGAPALSDPLRMLLPHAG